MDEDTARTVELPAALADRVEARLAYTEFDSVDDYVTFVVEEVLYAVEEASDDEELEAVDEAEVRSRLESLGYLE